MSLLITKENISLLEPGDLVEFTRGLYSHWGVYVGDEEIIHLIVEGGKRICSCFKEHLVSCSGKTFGDGCVKTDNIWTVAKRSEVYKNNPMDDKLTPLPKTEIVDRASKKSGKAAYNLLSKNCEHFANWSRYGIEISEQVVTAGSALIIVGFIVLVFVVVVAVVVAVAAAVAASLFGWIFKKKKQQSY